MKRWTDTYKRMHDVRPEVKRTPVIGITGNFGEKGCELAEGYYESVIRAGGTPVVLPPTTNSDVLRTTLDRVDAVLFSGGGDINPLQLGEEPIAALGHICPQRDEAELLLARMAFNRQLPMLGICRGLQVMVAALDGKLHQDIDSALGSTGRVKHSQNLERSYASHTVDIDKDSLLHHLFGCDTLAVNSFHHQAVAEAGPHLRVTARAKDGVVEAVESSEHKPMIGVQWHPECFSLVGDETMMPLFRWLVDEAALFAKARDFHRENLTLDSHCDTPMFFHQGIHFEQRDPRILVDLHKMREGMLDATIMVAYLPQGERTPEGHRAAGEMADSLLTQIEQLAEANSDQVELARTPADLWRIKAAGKRAIMRGIENGYAVGHDLAMVDHFCKRGIVYMTLCHNGNNDICGSARPREGEQMCGVTEFGAEVIGRLNDLGVMVDLSHASEQSFYDAIDISRKPIVCSHSSSKALCNHPRNLTDDQLRALAACGGVAQVTVYNGFLRTDGKATIMDALAHLDHMIDVAGIDHVGIGTDFDGDGGVPGLADASEVINFTRELLRRRYSEQDIAKIWGGNFLRVMTLAIDD